MFAVIVLLWTVQSEFMVNEVERFEVVEVYFCALTVIFDDKNVFLLQWWFVKFL
jgi:hypothetical protein